MTIKSSNNLSHTLVIMDASIKNNIATSISHIYIQDKPITKTLYHAVKVQRPRPNYLPLEAVSTRLPIPLVSLKPLLSQIQFTLQKRSLIHYHIPSKFIQLLSFKNFISSSLIVKKIQSNSGSVLADAIGLSTKLLTKRPSHSILSPCSLANCLGIIVRRTNAMTLLTDRK